MKTLRIATALLAALGWTLAVAAWAAPGASSGQPTLAQSSEAWRALLALPLPPDQPLPFDAADLLDKHGQPAEARQLRRALLVQHMRRASGNVAPLARDVGAARSAALAGGSRDLHAAFEAYLNAKLSAAPRTNESHALGSAGWLPLGDRFGLWSDPVRRRLAAFLSVHNGGDMHLPSQGWRLHVAAGEHGVALDCRQAFGGSTLPPGASRAWDCEAELPAVAVMKALRAADLIERRWLAPVMDGDPRIVDDLVRSLGPIFTPGVTELADRLARCGATLRCEPAATETARPRARPSQVVTPPPATRASASVPVKQPRDEPVDRDDTGRTRWIEWLVLAMVNPFTAVGMALLALAAYVLIRRAAGPWPAGLAIAAAGLASGNAVLSKLPTGAGWEGLMWLYAAGMVAVVTLAVVGIGPFVYRSVFMTRPARPPS